MSIQLTRSVKRGGVRATSPKCTSGVVIRKLDMLRYAHHLGDLRSPPSNRLEVLRGELAGLHSIRVIGDNYFCRSCCLTKDCYQTASSRSHRTSRRRLR